MPPLIITFGSAIAKSRQVESEISVLLYWYYLHRFLLLVKCLPIQLCSHNTFLISITPQPVLSLLFNREQAFVTFVTPPPLELPQINWYDSINIGKWQLMGTRFRNFYTDKWKCYSFSFHSFNPISDGIKNWARVIFTKAIDFFYLHKCLWIC